MPTQRRHAARARYRRSRKARSRVYRARRRESASRPGLDGVEVHGSQGHLLQQFLSPFSNQRTDRYGGSLERRMTFGLEILSGVRKACPPGFVVGFRLGAEEFTPRRPDVSRMQTEIAIASWRQPASIDYFSITQSNFNSHRNPRPTGATSSRTSPILYPAGIKGSLSRSCRWSATGQIIEPGACRGNVGGRPGGHHRIVPSAAGRRGVDGESRNRPRVAHQTLHQLQSVLVVGRDATAGRLHSKRVVRQRSRLGHAGTFGEGGDGEARCRHRRRTGRPRSCPRCSRARASRRTLRGACVPSLGGEITCGRGDGT